MHEISLCVFLLIWNFILCISAYDLYLSIRFQENLILNELNPLGMWLIAVDNGDIALFMAVKMFGTCIAFMLASAFFFYSRRMGLVASVSLAAFQLGLLLFLTCY